jgi:NAD(P)H-dependent FMN reductase
MNTDRAARDAGNGASMSLSIPLLTGSSRIGRRSAHVAAHVHALMRATGGITAPLLDLPIMEQRLADMTEPPPGLAAFSETLAAADALMIVTPEYKNGYPGSLKNALDYLVAGILRRKPIAICTVSSGSFGGISCLAQLRLICLAMGGLPIPESLPVSNVHSVFGEDGSLLHNAFDAKARRLIDDLCWYARRLKRNGD